ncbi:Scr1 family TA system antitoxin-like transcriptional regulator [Amycolatopsis arida]|uniref:Scr1 family TA system antitoxin-like transcriptional regulator n=1 Tax=Amycolatopsis arida TaxID=587909 RepID=UPI00106668AB|nr:Scr1 family TA system antitoxin-like transcriptional regulator [Amycolatopsis arida]
MLPRSAGPYSGLCQEFTLLRFRDDRPVVYTDCMTNSVLIEKPFDVEHYERILAKCAKAALDERQSQE